MIASGLLFKKIFGPSEAHANDMVWIFTIGGFLFPIVSLWNSRAIVPLVALMALSSLVVLIRTRHQREARAWDKYLLSGIIMFIVAVLISALQIDDPKIAIVSAAKIYGNVCIALVLIYASTYLQPENAKKAARCILMSVCIVGLFLLCDILTKGVLSLFFNNMTYTPKYKFFWFKSASAVFTVCALIAAFYLMLQKQIWMSVALSLVSVFIAANVGNRTAAIGILAGIVIGIGYQYLGKLRYKILSLILVLAFTAPLYALSFGVNAERISQLIEVRTSATISVVYRMYAWEFVTNRILEKPVLGWGLNGSKKFGGETAKIIKDPIMGSLGEPVPLHPHNGILQIWLELGAIGALAMLIIILRGAYLLDLKSTMAMNRFCTFSILALLMCFFLFSYSAFSSSWLALAIFALTMLNALCTRAGTKPS